MDGTQFFMITIISSQKIDVHINLLHSVCTFMNDSKAVPRGAIHFALGLLIISANLFTGKEFSVEIINFQKVFFVYHFSETF